MSTATEVARWMFAELERRGGWLPEEDAAAFIGRVFGREFASWTEGRVPTVNASVVDAFQQLNAGTVRWSPADRAWHYADATRVSGATRQEPKVGEASDPANGGVRIV